MRISSTAEAAKLFSVTPDASPLAADVDRFYCWHFHVYRFGRARMGVLVNDLTGFVIYLDRPTKVKMKRFAEAVHGLIGRAWLAYGVAPELVERYLEAAGAVTLNAKTDRSTLTRMGQLKEVIGMRLYETGGWPFDPASFDQPLYGQVGQPEAWGGINQTPELLAAALSERFGVAPDQVFKQAYVRLRIELVGLSMPVTRELAVPAAMSVTRLHDLIQVSFGWLDYHCHQFEGRMSGVDPETPAEPVWVSQPLGDREEWFYSDKVKAVREEATRVIDLFAPGLDVWYEYDFGDGWVHKITLLGTDCRADRRPALEGYEGICPPDDAGGPGGFESLLDQLNNSNDPEHTHAVSWTKQMIGHRFTEAELREALRTDWWLNRYRWNIERMWPREDEV